MIFFCYQSCHIYKKDKNDDPVDPKPQVSEIATNQQQLKTPEHAAPVNSDDNGTSTTQDHTGFAQNMSVPKPKRTIPEENTKAGVSPMNKYMTPMGDTATYCKYSPSTQKEPFPEQIHGARLPQ